MKRLFILFFIMICVSGCATITKGTSQSVLVDSDPQGAICRFNRLGEDVGVVNPTPGMLIIDKSMHSLYASCTKDGYYPAAGMLNSNYQWMTIGNALIGGIIGIAVDTISGAASVYDTSIKFQLKKVEQVNMDEAINDIKRN